MFTLVLVLLSFAALLAATPGVQRIIGGQDTPIEKVPWQVSFLHDGKHHCGGSIYNEFLIITAAHCIEQHIGKNFTIRAGSSKWNRGGVLVQVAAFKFHEKYTASRLAEYDVAVMRLANPLPIRGNIQPIPLAEEDPAEGSPALSSGWGATYNDVWDMDQCKLSKPINLRGVNIRIENKRKCYLKASQLKQNICAGVIGQSICFADSGGPLVVDKKLVGITSVTNNGCCLSPGIYASVAKFHSWILNALKEV
ncbi:uncharacterized protein Dana_GF19704 [Drosophila ananassae]|uniref:trypsin n=1 Tax=Drosophila ananassae TaxID=7217 RepID=B3MJ95_DROAN|nr:trypsin beta [Drosophila ananassae]EDV31305.1 uncharacterized protein Dana_GF19704 [Drosophila ananassae]